MKNNRGQALIQVIIAMGIFAFLIVSFMNAVSSQRKDIKFNQALITRNLLELRMQKYLNNSAALNLTKEVSFLGNSKFKSCYSAGATLCENSTTPVGFQLLDPNGVMVAGALGSTPVRYTSRGEVCTAGNNNDCVFEVFTHYTATCPGATATCISPNSLFAIFTIQQIAGTNIFGGFSFKSLVSSPVPVGSPPYNLTSYTRSHAAGTGNYPIGTHDFCALTRFVYDGDGAGDCIVSGAKKSVWTITISDEGDAQVQTCGAICVDFL